ncbi:MAG: hypothetical protein OHK0031_19210 [Anaerolineales bacterium]
MIRAVCEADGDPEDALSAAEIRNDWQKFDLNSDVWVVTDPAGSVIGYECRNFLKL